MHRVSVEPNALQQDVESVQSGLRTYNVAFIGDPNEKPVQVFLRDGEGNVVGGLLGHIKWRWMYIAKLWIAESSRGEGHGASLMVAAEEYARQMGCIGSYLDTFEYQARPFYEKLGYKVFGTLEDYPPEYRQFYLSKRLNP